MISVAVPLDEQVPLVASRTGGLRELLSLGSQRGALFANLASNRSERVALGNIQPTSSLPSHIATLYCSPVS